MLKMAIGLIQAQQGSVELRPWNNQNITTTKASSVESGPWNNQNTATTKSSSVESCHYITSSTSR